MSSVIRIGTVSKVNYEDGTIEVAYEDRDGSVTDEICVVSNALYRMPVVGAMVCVLHNSDSQEMGTCIGTFWNEDNKPVGGKKQRYRYDYNDKKGKAVEEFQQWQRSIGRDISPMELIYRLRVAGVKRVELRQPVYMVVEGGSDLEKATVQIPKLSGTPTIIYGGVEDD